MTDINTVYIGNKPPMAYVMAIITAFNSGADSVVLKARGRAISRAVDVAEIAKNRYLSDVQAKKIEVGTEQLPSQGGGTRGVSTIAITMERIQGEQPEPESETPSEVDKTSEAESAAAKTSDVSEIKGVGRATEEKLENAGFSTVESIATAETAELSEKTGISERVAAKLIDSAKELLNV